MIICFAHARQGVSCLRICGHCFGVYEYGGGVGTDAVAIEDWFDSGQKLERLGRKETRLFSLEAYKAGFLLILACGYLFRWC